jgi:hypothetical protein
MRCGSPGIEPERPLDQRWHWWEQAIPGEVEPVPKPAILHQEADELLGNSSMPAGLEDHCFPKAVLIIPDIHPA